MQDEATAQFTVLRQAARPEAVAALEDLVRHAPDRALGRINALDLAARQGVAEEDTIAALLHAARLGLFDLAWNVLCPGCGGVLHQGLTLKGLDQSRYSCALCAAGYEPTLDELVEVTFTVNPRVRRIAAHDPDALPMIEYFRQVFWGSGFDLPDDAALARAFDDCTLEAIELPAGERAVLSLQAPAAFLILFDPVTHMAQFLDVQGEPTRERQSLALTVDGHHAQTGTLALRPGPLRIAIENRAGRRTLPGLWIAGDALHDLLGRRRPFLTAARLLSNQTFRDLYGTDTLEPRQRLRITSLTFLFTDLTGSTELYDRVGDLAAYELVQTHFRLLQEIVAAAGGAVVKTIGDAVMASFPAPEQAVAAAVRMRAAIRDLRDDELMLKIGLHAGPCLAVMLNGAQDYFGQTVNVAARVQGLAEAGGILASAPVMEGARVAALLAGLGLAPQPQERALRGVARAMAIYEVA